WCEGGEAMMNFEKGLLTRLYGSCSSRVEGNKCALDFQRLNNKGMGRADRRLLPKLEGKGASPRALPGRHTVLDPGAHAPGRSLAWPAAARWLLPCELPRQRVPWPSPI